MRSTVRGFVVIALLVMLPALAESQDSLLSLRAPQWGATSQEIVQLYGNPVGRSWPFLLYRPDLLYGSCEVRFALGRRGLRQIVIAIEPGAGLAERIVRDVTALLRTDPERQEVREGILYLWDNGHSAAQFGPLPPRSSKEWVTLQFTSSQGTPR